MCKNGKESYLFGKDDNEIYGRNNEEKEENNVVQISFDYVNNSTVTGHIQT